MLFHAIHHPLVGQQTLICVKFKGMSWTCSMAQFYDCVVTKTQEHTCTFNRVCFCSPVYAVKNYAIIKPRKLIRFPAVLNLYKCQTWENLKLKIFP